MAFKKSSETDVAKKPNTKSTYTEQELLDLFMCGEDPIFFMRNFVKVQHPIKGSLPFLLYDYQERMIEAFLSNRFNVVMTSRQMGKTATAAAFLLWKAMFCPDTTILITANNRAQAQEIMDRIRYAYENLPNHIRAGAVDYNKGTVSFDNGSKIVARATTPHAGRGLSITLLYCLAGKTTVTVRDKLTGIVSDISLEELYESL